MQSFMQVDEVYHTFCSASILSTFLVTGPYVKIGSPAAPLRLATPPLKRYGVDLSTIVFVRCWSSLILPDHAPLSRPLFTRVFVLKEGKVNTKINRLRKFPGLQCLHHLPWIEPVMFPHANCAVLCDIHCPRCASWQLACVSAADSISRP